MSNYLSIQNLSFSFDHTQDKHFFKNISCAFKKNTMNFIRGRNGAGKSTLFRILRGKIEPIESVTGTAILNGHTYDLSQVESRRNFSNDIRLAPQKFDEMLADQFTFPENLQLAGMPTYPGLTPFVPATDIPELVARFGIDYTVPAGMLSGGQRQILSILMALQKSARILLLDEPTAALDDKNSSMVMAFLHDLLKTSKDLTILVICHDKELVNQYAEHHYYEIEIHPDDTRSIELIPLMKESTT